MWLNNMKSLLENGKVGQCPFCKSDNTDYNATKLTENNMGYLVMWCNDCKHSHIISRLKITDNMKSNQNVPNDLI